MVMKLAWLRTTTKVMVQCVPTSQVDLQTDSLMLLLQKEEIAYEQHTLTLHVVCFSGAKAIQHYQKANLHSLQCKTAFTFMLVLPRTVM